MNQPAGPRASFPETDWFRQFAAFLETDQDYKTHGKWLAARIAFRVGQDTTVLTVDRGLVLDVAPGHAEFDYLIAGTRDQWRFLLETGWGLVRLYRSGTLTIRGDAVKLMQNWKPIFFIAEAMKNFERQA